MDKKDLNSSLIMTKALNLHEGVLKINAMVFGIIAIPLASCAQNVSCEDLKYGVYEVYENNEKVGVIYRKDNLQLEDYLDGNELSPTKLREKDCYFYINSFEIREAIDTVTMFVEYKEIKRNHYTFLAKPKYLNLDYEYKGEIKKISNDIEPDVLKVFKKLENSSNKNTKFN